MVIFFLSYCLLFNKITLNKGNVGTNHLNNRILLFVCNRKVIYYYYITLPSITITITITFGNFQSITITITITGKSGYYYYNYILHITITPSLMTVYPTYFATVRGIPDTSIRRRTTVPRSNITWPGILVFNIKFIQHHRFIEST